MALPPPVSRRTCVSGIREAMLHRDRAPDAHGEERAEPDARRQQHAWREGASAARPHGHGRNRRQDRKADDRRTDEPHRAHDRAEAVWSVVGTPVDGGRPR